MPLKKLARDAGNVAIYRATWGGSQNFLGARWVERVVDNSPELVRERVAMRFLSLSPHYYYDRDIDQEDIRYRRSRQVLADELIAPHLTPQTRVLDYGCGPGYLAAAVAARAALVTAVDISRGVLACARALNGRPNISYLTPAELWVADEQADLAYSFAVVQHLQTETLEQVLSLMARSVRPGGTLLLHFAVPDPVAWRTEDQWRVTPSLATRAKLRYALNCFGRTPEQMIELAGRHGFTEASVRSLAGTLIVPGDDDVPNQHLMTARRARPQSHSTTVSICL
jgi:SAM-dependent methyltransferase